MLRILVLGLSMAGLVVPADAHTRSDPSIGGPGVAAPPVSRDGDVPVSARIIPGSDLRPAAGGARGCAPYADVGTDPEGDSAAGAAFGPDGSWFVLAHRDSRNLLVYDADTRDLIREIPLSGSPVDLAVSADGRWAVTPNLYEDSASIVDLDAGVEVAVLPMGEAPMTARITPDGARAIVGCMVSGELVVLDLPGASELRRIANLDFAVTLSANFETFAVTFGCSNPPEMAGNSVAVFPDYFNDRIGFADLDAGTISYIGTSDAPLRTAVRGDGAVAIVSHTFGTSDDLDVVDVPGRAIMDTINIGTDLYGPVSLSPDGSKAAVAVQNAVRMVNLTTGAVGPNLNTASVNGLLTTADGQYALCVGFRGSLISYATENIVKELNNFVSCSLGAVSPADSRGVMLATTFGEDMVVVNTAGAAGFREDVRPSGPAPEGDKPRTIAVTPDGSTVLTTNQFSRNVSVFNASSMSLLGHVETGLRPGQVKVTPDGLRAVVTNRDDTFITVIDLATLDSDTVAISTRGDQLEISPDGTYAYIAVVTSDGVWRVNLDTLSVEGAKLATGDMGGVGYTGNQFSGMSLSRDGATLVTCNSFSDSVTIIDTASWSVAATVNVGDFPTSASFSPDDGRIYVTNRGHETVSVVTNAGGGSSQIAVIDVGAYPYRSVASDDGATLYVMNTSDEDIGVVDTALFVMHSTIPLPATPVGLIHYNGHAGLLAAYGTGSASSNGDFSQSGGLAIIDIATNAVVEEICADHFLSDLAADPGQRLAAGAGLGGESAVFFDVAECEADVNGDGVVDTRDVLAFLNLWAAQDDRADWDGNGVVDTRDVLAFLNDWVAGC